MNKRRVLADQFGKQKRWVVWRYETVKGKKTKIPYDLTGKKASSTDKKTWSTYDDAAVYANENDATDGVGLVFTPSQTLLGIDIDHCITGERITHALRIQIQKLIEVADTYCEISPSRGGLHLFLQIDEPLELEAHKRAPYELYTRGRYFTVTNTPFGEIKPVRTVTLEEVKKILSIIEYPWKEKEMLTKTEVSLHSPSEDQLFVRLDDEQLLKKMFASKNGEDIKLLFDGDTSAHGKDASKADMALCSHLAFWTGKEKSQMDRLWLLSPLGKREKTQTRAEYRSRTIDFAIEHCKEIYVPPLQSSPVLDLLYTLDAQKRKLYTQNMENMCRILRKHPDFAGRFKYNVFKNTCEIRVGSTWRDFQDSDILDIQSQISILFSIFGTVNKMMIYDAIMKVMSENQYDSAIDYIKSSTWDGTARLDTWMHDVYGAPDDVYHRAVASNFLKGLVKRVIEPGCKFDYVLVLEGRQGSKKSTSLAVLAGSELGHVETTMSTDTKDFFMQFQGNAIVEFSEGETLNRTEIKRMKAIITTQHDKFRPPFGKVSVDFPRRCIFAMTTNQDEYLKDETGNRRWLPVSLRIPQADTEWLSKNRGQLFAEAYHRAIEKEETVYEFPELETAAEQHKRRVVDPNTEQVVHWYYSVLQDEGRARGVTVFQVIRDALHGGFMNRGITKSEQMGIASILRDFMGLEHKQVMEGGERAWKWFNTRDVAIENLLPASLDF